MSQERPHKDGCMESKIMARPEVKGTKVKGTKVKGTKVKDTIHSQNVAGVSENINPWTVHIYSTNVITAMKKDTCKELVIANTNPQPLQ